MGGGHDEERKLRGGNAFDIDPAENPPSGQRLHKAFAAARDSSWEGGRAGRRLDLRVAAGLGFSVRKAVQSRSSSSQAMSPIHIFVLTYLLRITLA